MSASGPDGGRPPGGSETILLVEDEETVRDVTRKLLTKLGYEVITARDAEEGIEIFEREADAIHAVVTDVVMPGLTGVQMATRLREIRGDTKVLFVSGYASRDVGGSPEELPEPFLPKPFTLEELAHALRTVLDGSTRSSVEK